MQTKQGNAEIRSALVHRAWPLSLLTIVRAAFLLLIFRLGREEDEDEDADEESRFLLGWTLGPADADAGGWEKLGGGTVGVGVVVRTSARAGGVERNRAAASVLGAWARSLEWRRAERDMVCWGWADRSMM